MAGFSDGDAAASRFYGPRGVVVSPDGKYVYVADYSNFRVRSISLEDGQVSTIMGGDEESGAASGGANSNVGSGTNAYRPAGVAVSPDGKIIFAADSANNRIRSIKADGGSWGLPPGPQPGQPGGVNTGSNFTRGVNIKGDSYWSGNGVHPPDSYNDRYDLGGNAELVVKQRVLIIIVTLIILGVMAVAGLVAGALWQRRNALLMLRLAQGAAHHSQQHHKGGGGQFGHHGYNSIPSPTAQDIPQYVPPPHYAHYAPRRSPTGGLDGGVAMGGGGPTYGGGGYYPQAGAPGQGLQRTTSSHTGFSARNTVRRSSMYNGGRGGGGQLNAMGGITLPVGGGGQQGTGSAVFRRSTSAANIGVPAVSSNGNVVSGSGYATGSGWQNIV